VVSPSSPRRPPVETPVGRSGGDPTSSRGDGRRRRRRARADLSPDTPSRCVRRRPVAADDRGARRRGSTGSNVLLGGFRPRPTPRGTRQRLSPGPGVSTSGWRTVVRVDGCGAHLPGATRGCRSRTCAEAYVTPARACSRTRGIDPRCHRDPGDSRARRSGMSGSRGRPDGPTPIAPGSRDPAASV
jgi:hypothetical protein